MDINEFTARVNELEKASVVIKKKKAGSVLLFLTHSPSSFAVLYSQEVLREFFDQGLTPEETHSRLIKPVDRIPLDDGSIFVKLQTIEELEEFWKENQRIYPFFVRSGSQDSFLDSYDWVFSRSKAGAVKAAFRWDQVGIKCVWYDWVNDTNPVLISDGLDAASWFKDRDEWRKNKIQSGNWTDSDEATYQADLISRSPQTYRGWWVLTNLPNNLTHEELFLDSVTEASSVFDPAISIEDVAKLFQEIIFNLWLDENHALGSCSFGDQISLAKFIEYWKEERAQNNEYYGEENENVTDRVSLKNDEAEPPPVHSNIEAPPIVNLETKSLFRNLGYSASQTPIPNKTNPLVTLADHLREASSLKRQENSSFSLPKKPFPPNPFSQYSKTQNGADPGDSASMLRSRKLARQPKK